MPSRQPEPAEPPHPHHTSAQVLAAVQRAVRHAPTPGADASTASVLAHLGVAPRSAAARSTREALARLQAAGMLDRSRSRGRTCWRVAQRGAARLRALRGAGAAPQLPESPQHRAWRTARAVAGDEIGRLRGELTGALRELETLAKMTDPPPASDALFAHGELVRGAARRLGSAVHCLHERREPADERADVDMRDEPTAGTSGAAPRWMQALRGGRRNVRLWD